MNQQDLQLELLQLFQQSGLTQGLQLPMQQQATPRQLFEIPLLQLHNYWKSKIVQIYSNWKNVTDTVDLEKLDKRNMSAEKHFEKQEMPIFKLGDRVKIFANEKRYFRMLQKRVGLWNESLIELIDKEAIVMNISSRYAIGVALVENGETVQIHGFALKPVKNGGPSALWKNETDFKVNDEVVIGVDSGVLTYLQQTNKTTPSHRAITLATFVARVMGFFRGDVLVTFNEMIHEVFNPAALQLYTEQKNGNQMKLGQRQTGKAKKDNETFSVFEIGQTLTMKPNLREVMREQIGHGDWNYEMTKFYGKVGTVVDHVPGGDVIVKFDPFESYRMNQNCLDKTNKKHQKTKSENAISADPLLNKFAVGDIVRFGIDVKDLLGLLLTLHIPTQFFSIVTGIVAEFVGYVDERRGVINFGDGVKLLFELHLLKKVDAEISEYHKKLRQADKNIGVGKEVVLWTGPHYFSKICVKPSKKGFEKALREIAIVQGYEENGNTVIKYSDDDNIYSLPEEFLCSPRTEWKQDIDANKVGFMTVRNPKPIEVPVTVSANEVQILHSVTEVLKSYGEPGAIKWESRITDVVKKNYNRKIDINFLTKLEDRKKFLETFISKMRSDNMFDAARDNFVFVKVDEKMYLIQFHFDVLENSSEISITENYGAIPLVSNETPVRVTTQIGEHDSSSANLETSFEQGASATTKQETKMDANEKISEFGSQDNSATPVGQVLGAPFNISIPSGVRQVVLNLGGRNPALSPQAPSTDLSANAVQPAIMMNPVIHMHGDGENRINIDKSFVRAVNQSN